MKKKSLKRGFSERIDFKRELIRDTTRGLDSEEAVQEETSSTPKKSTAKKTAPRAKKKEAAEKVATIKVIGVGGGGTNAVNQMIEAGIESVDLIVVNTDIQSLQCSLAPQKIQIGASLTRGLGTGGNPKLGEDAARMDKEKIAQLVEGADLVFVTACMGGGTGTGASPVIAELAREAGALTIGVVTKPFSFEGARRARQALEGIENLRKVVDALIVIPNDRLMEIADRDTSLREAFKKADFVLYQAVRGIADLITSPQDINLDLADLRTVLTGAGTVLIGIGHGRGKDKAKQAAEMAISSPLLEVSIRGARSILLSITGGPDTGIHEVKQIVDIINKAAGTETDLLFGNKIDPEFSNEILVTLVATRFESAPEEKTEEVPPLVENIAVDALEQDIDDKLIIEDDLDVPAFLREEQKKGSEGKARLDEVLGIFKRSRRE
ncbi:MAG: cell division protein FtsZ [Candidatus Atribacteria bacterium]|uniref:cell division protein FtsZ n=1 Tax=Atrimonas thermophila TaxID=3064161 RepID=UPI0024AC0DC7|nr:cell division protein FtsZ [Candidatus Atribacteria bacterium]